MESPQSCKPSCQWKSSGFLSPSPFCSLMYHHFFNEWSHVLKKNRNLQPPKYSHFWQRNEKCSKLFSRNKWAVTAHDEGVSSVLFPKYKKAIKILAIFSVSHRFFLFFFSPPVVFCFSFNGPFFTLLRITFRPGFILLKKLFYFCLKLYNFRLNWRGLLSLSLPAVEYSVLLLSLSQVFSCYEFHSGTAQSPPVCFSSDPLISFSTDMLRHGVNRS